ncbi:MAG TPA: hypothetical protein VFP10_04500 [Candidatus Eisenbacteria bacterium]|nr:hypothetical protein [Candidatus Eisenbacteria bacterium]
MTASPRITQSILRSVPLGATVLALALYPSGGWTAPPSTETKTEATTSKTDTKATATSKGTPSKTTSKTETKSTAGSKTETKSTPPDSTTLKGGTSGTQFPDMTVTGEDRIRIDFERPELILDLEAKSAPGLERERTLDIVDRGAPDLNDPLLTQSAGRRSDYTGRPWLSHFSNGAVARFRPALSKVERWTLQVADSRGNTVAKFQGQGRVPEQIVWDGRTMGGDLALPGLTYSYVFEAYDEAGNKRNFLGDAFTVNPYIREEKTGITLLVPGTELAGKASPGQPFPILLETASWLNQLERVDGPVIVEAHARTRDEAVALATKIGDALPPLLLGPKSRLEIRQNVVDDAPESGVCIVKATS